MTQQPGCNCEGLQTLTQRAGEGCWQLIIGVLRVSTWSGRSAACPLTSRMVRAYSKTTFPTFVFGRPFVKWFALCYPTVVCLSVTLVYCDQTVGWMHMPLGTEVDLGPDDIVLD